MKKIFIDINKNIYQVHHKKGIQKIQSVTECNDGIVFVYNSTSNVDEKIIYSNIFETNIKETLIKKELETELSFYVSSSRVNEDENYKYLFGLEKEYFLYLVEDCGFSEVYPLEYFLYTYAKEKATENVGIVSNKVILIKEYEGPEDLKSNYLLDTNKDTFYYLNSDPEIFIESIKKSYDDIDHLFILSKDFLELNHRETTDLDEFFKSIERFRKEYKELCIVDKISKKYKKSILNKYLYFADFILIIFIVGITMKYLNSEINYTTNNEKLEIVSSKLKTLEATDKKIKRYLPKMSFNNLKFNKIRRELIPFTRYQPLKFDYMFNNDTLTVNLLIQGIDKVEALKKYLDYRKVIKYQVSNRKKGFKFNFLIKIPLSKKAVKLKSNKRRKR